MSRPTSRTGRRGQPPKPADLSSGLGSAPHAAPETESSEDRQWSSPRNRETGARQKPQSAKRILVLDPGFRSLTGHHYNINVALVEAAASMNAEFRILAGETCENMGKLESVTTPFFKTDLYEGASQFPESWEFDSWLHVNAKFRADLKRIDPDPLAWANLILVPAVTQFHMFALAQWLRDTLEQHLELKAVIQLMFSPTWTAWDAICEAGEQMYADAFACLAPYEGKRVFYTSELKSSCREFEHMLSSEVHVLPHAGIWRPEKTRTVAASDVPTIGFFGVAKREKGFQLLPEIVREIRRTLLPSDAHMIIQINHGGYDALIEKADRDLRELAGPGLELRLGSMSEEDYLDAFESADIQLLPYDPLLYRGRGSGVFSEAIGYGKIVVAPRASGVGEEIAQGRGAGVLFDRHSARDVARAVEEAVRRAPELASQARRHAEQWRKAHSGQGYLAIIDQLVS